MKTIIALESPWSVLKKGSLSTLPMIYTLSSLTGCIYYSAKFYNKSSFDLVLKDLWRAKKGLVYLYIASHATESRIQTMYDEARDINIDTIINTIKKNTGSNLNGIFFGCCSIGNGLSDKIVSLNESGIKAQWIFGYKNEVDWWKGTLVDMNILYNIISSRYPKSIKHIISAVAKGINTFSEELTIYKKNKLYKNFILLVKKRDGYIDATDDVKKELG